MKVKGIRLHRCADNLKGNRKFDKIPIIHIILQVISMS